MMDDLETPQLVASQAFVSQAPGTTPDMIQVIMNFMQQMQQNQEASNRQNMEYIERQRMAMETQLEQQRLDMLMRLEQQRLDMAAIAEKTAQNMVNSVPLIEQNALMGLGSALNVAPLQLKGPAS